MKNLFGITFLAILITTQAGIVPHLPHIPHHLPHIHPGIAYTKAVPHAVPPFASSVSIFRRTPTYAIVYTHGGPFAAHNFIPHIHPHTHVLPPIVPHAYTPSVVPHFHHHAPTVHSVIPHLHPAPVLPPLVPHNHAHLASALVDHTHVAAPHAHAHLLQADVPHAHFSSDVVPHSHAHFVPDFEPHRHAHLIPAALPHLRHIGQAGPHFHGYLQALYG